MSADHRRYLILEQGVGAAIFNFFVGGAIAWGVFRHLDVVPLWGGQSVAGDTIATGVLLPLLTSLIANGIVRRQVLGGKVRPLADAHPAVAWMPGSAFVRGLLLALAVSLTLVPATLALLAALGVSDMTLWPFILFKASWAALAAFVVQPIVALRAIGEARVRTPLAA
jgi:hypothetical protein